MKNTTLCYIEKDGAYLMLHRVKKQQDINKGKWTGVGGKFENEETPEECLLREVKEETGLFLTDYRLRGIVTFISDSGEGEYMYLFTAGSFTGEVKDCDEGVLEWINKEEVPGLCIWEGDRLFLEELNKNRGFFTMKLKYKGERLEEARTYIY